MRERLFKGTRTWFKIRSLGPGTPPGWQSRGRERQEAGVRPRERGRAAVSMETPILLWD